MLRKLLCVVLLWAVCLGSVLAADGVVVSFDKATQKLVVKVGEQEKTYELKASTHVHDVNGKEVSSKDRADKLTKDTKLDLVEKNGKLIEINIKK